jgi:hypothetical protein
MRGIWGVIAVTVAMGARAEAIEWGARLEPSAAFPVAAPQTRLFGFGGSLALKGGIAPARFVDVFLSLQLVGLSATSGNPNQDPGLAWALGVGARLRRPHSHPSYLHPWLDGDLSYVRTGSLDRFGFSLAAGLAIAAGEGRRFWVGPFLRYFQVVSPDRDGYDSRDALMLLAGVSVEYSPPPRVRTPVPEPPAATQTPPPREEPPPKKDALPPPDVITPPEGDD